MELLKNIFSWKAFVAILPLFLVIKIANTFEGFIGSQGFDGNASKEAYMSYTTYFITLRVICGLIVAAAFLLPLQKWPFISPSLERDDTRLTLGNCHLVVVGLLYISLILLTMILNIGMPSMTSI